jgi:carbamoyltransferase
MLTLGLGVFDDASSSIVKDGEIVYAIEEERLNRIKHYSGIPFLSIDECLKYSGIRIEELDKIAIGWNPYFGWITRTSESLKSIISNGESANLKFKRGGSYLKGCINILKLKKSLSEKYNFRDKIPPINYVNHHFAHAASVYFTSPYENCNIFVADGIGESDTISFFKAMKGKIKRINSIKYPASLGHLYASITGFLGFKMTCDEGKVMALASYGEDNYRDVFERVFRVGKSPNDLKMDISILDYHSARWGGFSKKWLDMVGMMPRKKGEPLNKKHKDLTCSLQNKIERIVFSLLEQNFPEGKGKPLCSAGGLFLNSVLNGKIINEYTSDYYIFPATGDNGVSIGSALYTNSLNGTFKKNVIKDAYFGNGYSRDIISNTILKSGIDAEKHDNVFNETAELLEAGKVVGWYRGRMEFGPRALGNRSILANPKPEWMKDLVNEKVKHRESFRPFAAAVLLEDANEYFENLVESPFMLKVFKIKDKYKNIFPAIIHVDNSCRVQTVSKENNPDFYKLLLSIKERSGHGIILNTSMNDAGEPIINTPEEAIRLFKKTKIDVMVLEDYILKK